MSSFSCFYCDFETNQSSSFITHCQKSKKHINNCKKKNVCYKCFYPVSCLNSFEDHDKECDRLNEKFYEKMDKSVVILINKIGLSLQIIENFEDEKLININYKFYMSKKNIYNFDNSNFGTYDIYTAHSFGFSLKPVKAKIMSKLNSLVLRNIITEDAESSINKALGFVCDDENLESLKELEKLFLAQIAIDNLKKLGFVVE